MKIYQKKIIKLSGGIFGIFLLVYILTFLFVIPVSAAQDVTTDTVPFEIGINLSSNGEDAGLIPTLQMLLALTVIALAPSILIMLTSFTRIIVVLHFVRSALTTQTTPPNQVMIGLALFLTFFLMMPVFSQINTEAIKPLSQNEISVEEAFDRGVEPLRAFMFKNTKAKDLKLFLEIAKVEIVATDGVLDLDLIPTSTLIPAFIISELRAAFIMGFLIYIPFLVIDMVVASTLMSMGMMMLPPTTISMPFKILLFIMVDGWNLVIEAVVKSFLMP